VSIFFRYIPPTSVRNPIHPTAAAPGGMTLAGLLPAHADVLSPLADQVTVEGHRFTDGDPNDQLRFLGRAHLKHLNKLGRAFAGMFPQSFILTLLPAHLDPDKIAEAVAKFTMSLYATNCPVMYRLDNLKIDPEEFPGWEMGEQLLPVCTVLRKDTNGVLFCIHVRPPTVESELWQPDNPNSPRIQASFRSALLLVGQTGDASWVRDRILNAYMNGGWVICGHNAMLFDVAMKQLVDCGTIESRTRTNCVALAKAVLGYLCQSTNRRPVRIRFVQGCLRLSDHYGWPVPEGTLDGVLSEAFRRTTGVTVLDGGRVMIHGSSGNQTPMNQTYTVLVQVVRKALEGEAGNPWPLVRGFLFPVGAANTTNPDAGRREAQMKDAPLASQEWAEDLRREMQGLRRSKMKTDGRSTSPAENRKRARTPEAQSVSQPVLPDTPLPGILELERTGPGRYKQLPGP